jgi:DNA mismatch repair ATPase MutS
MAKKLPDLERMLSRIHGKTCKKKDFIAVIEVRLRRFFFVVRTVSSPRLLT